MKSVNERVTEFRKRRKKAGWVRIELWAPSDLKQTIIDFANKLLRSKS